VIMKFRSTAVAAGLMAAVLGFAGPAQADSTSSVDQFLTALDGLGISNINPTDAVALGQSLCPLIAQRSQNTADIAAKVSDSLGKPLGIGTMFTGAAVSFLCPKAVDNIANGLTAGKLPLPLFG
jgi:hypothetical protein